MISKYIFLGGNRIASIQKNSQDASTKVRFYHSDHLGSSNVVTDEEGKLAQLLEYTPFGVTSRQEGEEPTKYRFTSKEFDDTTSLYYYGARYYDPELGRFITADPTIQHPYDPQDFNRYSYARNNPVKYIDPTGLGWWSNFWKGLIGGLVGGLTFGLLLPVMGPIGAAIIAGMAGGATTGALYGGWQGALKGAALGGLMVTGSALFGPLFAIGALSIGGINAYRAGGWEGLGDYAAGLAGGVIGFAAGFGIGAGISKSYTKTNSNLKGQDTKRQNRLRAKKALETKKTPSDSIKQRIVWKRRDVRFVYDDEITNAHEYRFIGPEEATKIANNGKVPNVDIFGDTKPVFSTPDELPTMSGSELQKIYNLPSKPTHIAIFEQERVTYIYGGSPVEGGAIGTSELVTYQERTVRFLIRLDD